MVTMQAYKPFKLGYCNCGCNQLINVRTQNRLRRYKHGHNSKLESNPNWRGGKHKSNGYYIIRVTNHHSKTQKDGYIYEHRYIYETYYNCCLLKSTDIDHINKNKLDNRIENLRAISKSEHSSYHHKGEIRKRIDMSNRICLICNRTDTYINKNGYVQWLKYNDGFMCHKCNWKIKNAK